MTQALRIVLLCLAFGQADIAMAEPSYIRHGYPSCAACHVSPVGGGALTRYGRGSGVAMATWGHEGEGSPLYGAAGPVPEWLMVGGDQRGVGILSRPSSGKTDQRFVPMQYDLELAVNPPTVPALVVGASIGSYGPDRAVEYRRTYLKLDLSESLSLRAGNFLTAYGVNLADHTTLTRSELGLGQGGETYNAELAWLGSWGESILTMIYGDRATIVADASSGYDTEQGEELSGLAWRGAVYAGSKAQLGASFLGVSNFQRWRQAYGVFAQVGFGDKLYLLAEYDRKFETGTVMDLAMVKAGYEMYRGLSLTAQWDTAGTVRVQRAGIQWWPRPHWEIVLEERRTYTDLTYKVFVDSGVLLLHHYL